MIPLSFVTKGFVELSTAVSSSLSSSPNRRDVWKSMLSFPSFNVLKYIFKINFTLFAFLEVFKDNLKTYLNTSYIEETNISIPSSILNDPNLVKITDNDIKRG